MPTFKDNPALIREVIMDHYEYPRNKKLKNDPSYTNYVVDFVANDLGVAREELVEISNKNIKDIFDI